MARRSSVRALLAKVEKQAHEGLTELIREHAFVGIRTPFI